MRPRLSRSHGHGRGYDGQEAGRDHRTRHSAGCHLAVPSGNHRRCAEAGPRTGAHLVSPAVPAEATAMAYLLVMIILGVAVYSYVLWTMRRLRTPAGSSMLEKGGGGHRVGADRIGTGQNSGAVPRDASGSDMCGRPYETRWTPWADVRFSGLFAVECIWLWAGCLAAPDVAHHGRCGPMNPRTRPTRSAAGRRHCAVLLGRGPRPAAGQVLHGLLDTGGLLLDVL